MMMSICVYIYMPMCLYVYIPLSLLQLNSMTGSGSANSFMPFYEAGRNMLTNKFPSDHQAKNISLSVNPNDAVDSEFVPNVMFFLEKSFFTWSDIDFS